MTEGKDRVSIQEAARLLDTTEGAIRKRIQRGSLASEKDQQGRVYVRVDAGQTSHDERQDAPQHSVDQLDSKLIEAKDETIQVLREQLEAERESSRRKDHIIAGLVQRIPELEAAEEMHESYDSGHESHEEPPQRDENPDEGYTPAEETAEPQTGSQRPAQKAPWWKRIFGG